jgi:RNA ligase
MHLTDLFSAADLQAQISAGMVKATPDPSGRLTILNYTQRAQFTPELWNRVTDLCRGLIVDNDGNVVARAFEKFWT